MINITAWQRFHIIYTATWHHYCIILAEAVRGDGFVASLAEVVQEVPVAVERLHEVAAFLAEAHPKDLLLEELGEVFRLHGLFRLALIPHYLLIIKRPTVICSYLLIPPQLSEIGRFYGGGRFYLLARVRSALSPFYSSPRQKSISH